MKYLQTFENLKDIYGGKEIGKTNSIYFIVTENEKWVLRNADFGHTEKTKLVYLTKTEDNDNYFPKITHYYSFETKSDAQKIIDTINNGPYGWKGMDKDGTEPKPNFHSGSVDWEVDKLPFRGYLEFSNTGGRHNNMKKEYPDTNIDRTTYTINGYEFKEDSYNRYRPYQQSQQSMLYLTDLRGKLKVVKYTYGLMRDEGLNI